MEKIQLGKLGEKPIHPPGLGSCLEFVTLWATHGTDPGLLARICSGAIGLCTDKAAILPKYRPSVHKPLDYGYICMERLLEKGITSSVIYSSGSNCLMLMSKQLPVEEEVEETMGFFPPNQESSSD